jgi:arginyl-tRNA synthetase
LGVEFDYYNGESFYEDKIEAIIDLGKSKGMFVESQGALICETDNPDEPPAIIQKKDGASLYLTRDLARVAYWEKTWQPEMMVNVVDIAQSLQLRQVYEVSSKLGLTKAKNIHVAFGRMQFADGSMSTRKGNIVLIEDLLNETRKRAKNQIVSLSKGLSSTEETELTEILAVNALKYNILRQNRLSNIIFDWQSILSLEGNSAPYLAYTVVRMRAIHREGELRTDAKRLKKEFDTEEIELLLQLSKAVDVLSGALDNFQPSDVANYCYDLCRIYNSFYHSHRVLEGESIFSERLLLNDTALRVVSVCFEVLGLRIPSKM